jgi:hypothetical protein
MTDYKVCDLVLRSNIPLPELPATEGVPSCTFELVSLPSKEPQEVLWFHEWRLPDGRPWVFFGRRGSEYFLRFPELAEFRISGDGGTISCVPVVDGDEATIRHLLLDQVIPMMLSLKERLVLHAGAVATKAGAIAFLGRSGRGKSTLTAGFSRRGIPLVTDDCLLLRIDDEGYSAIPSYPGARLWDDVIPSLFEKEPAVTRVATYNEKKRISLQEGQLRFCGDPIPLKNIYSLGLPEEASGSHSVLIRRLPPREAFMELVQHAYFLDFTDRGRLQEKFESIAGLSARYPVYRLAYRHDLSQLSAVQEAILRHAENPSD